MKPFVFACLVVFLPFTAAVGAKSEHVLTPAAMSRPAVDEVVRLQIFLDERNFGPGRIDGQYGGFTAKSWQNYQRSQGVTQPTDKFDAKVFTSVDPTYTTYLVTADDLAALGQVPKELALQAKQKALPYTSLDELLGERYHVSVDFLQRLNTGKKFDQLKAGDKVKVPNVVPPFNLAQVIALRQYTAERDRAIKAAKAQRDAVREAGSSSLAEMPSASPTISPPEEMPGPTIAISALAPPPATLPPVPTPSLEASTQAASSVTATTASVENRPTLRATPANSSRLVFYVNTATSYLEVRDGDRFVACFPITPGSKSIPTPKGDWHVVAKTLLPEFRWDKSVLMTGKRSSTFYQLPPGPNNPVGICWIALNKPGIGMHGTAEPDTIGRSASHGCIRLSNWDAFKVYGMVAPNTKVVIE